MRFLNYTNIPLSYTNKLLKLDPSIYQKKYLWEFEDNLTDSTGNLSFTLNNGSISYSTGKINNCLSLSNNSASSVATTNRGFLDAINKSMTISFWFKTSGHQESSPPGYFPPYENLIIAQKPPSEPFYIRIGNDPDAYNYKYIEVRRSGYGPVQEAPTGIDLLDGNWHLLVYSYNYEITDYSNIWIDNESGFQYYSPGGLSLDISTFYIGVPGGTSYFSGSIDQLRIYNYAISTDERNALWNSGSGI